MKIKHFIEELGFSSLGDLASTLSGFKTIPLIIVQVSFAWAINITGFVRHWVYDPPNAVFVVVGLIISDTILAISQAVKAQGKVDLRKLTRMIPVILTHVGIMSASFHFAKVDPESFSWMPTAVFAFFGIRHLISVIKNATRLGLLKGDLLEVLNTRIASTEEDAEEKGSGSDFKSGAAALLVLLASTFLIGCATQTRCYKRWPYVQGDTVWLHDTVKVLIPGTNTQANVPSRKLLDLRPGDSLSVTSPDGNTKAVVKRLAPTESDSLGGFQIAAQQKGRVEVRTIRLPCPPQKYLLPKPEIIYKVPVWVWVSFGVLGSIIIYLLLKRLI